MSNGIDRSQILSQLKVILTPQEYTACEGLNDAELSAKLREALSNNGNLGVGDSFTLTTTTGVLESPVQQQKPILPTYGPEASIPQLTQEQAQDVAMQNLWAMNANLATAQRETDSDKRDNATTLLMNTEARELYYLDKSRSPQGLTYREYLEGMRGDLRTMLLKSYPQMDSAKINLDERLNSLDENQIRQFEQALIKAETGKLDKNDVLKMFADSTQTVETRTYTQDGKTHTETSVKINPPHSHAGGEEEKIRFEDLYRAQRGVEFNPEKVRQYLIDGTETYFNDPLENGFSNTTLDDLHKHAAYTQRLPKSYIQAFGQPYRAEYLSALSGSDYDTSTAYGVSPVRLDGQLNPSNEGIEFVIPTRDITQETRARELDQKELKRFSANMLYNILNTTYNMLKGYYDGAWEQLKSGSVGTAAVQGFLGFGEMLSGQDLTVRSQMDNVEALLAKAIKLKNMDDDAFEQNFEELFKEISGTSFDIGAMQNFAQLTMKGVKTDTDEYDEAVKRAFGSNRTGDADSQFSILNPINSVTDIVAFLAGSEVIGGTKLFAQLGSKSLQLTTKAATRLGFNPAGKTVQAGIRLTSSSPVSALNMMTYTGLTEVGGTAMNSLAERINIKKSAMGEYMSVLDKVDKSLLDDDMIRILVDMTKQGVMGSVAPFIGAVATKTGNSLAGVFSKGNPTAIQKSFSTLAKAENKTLNAQSLMKDYLSAVDGSTFTKAQEVLSKSSAFITEVGGFTGYSTLEHIAEGLITGELDLDSIDLGEEFKGQLEGLATLKGVARFIQMRKSGAVARGVQDKALNDMTEQLKNYDITDVGGQYRVLDKTSGKFQTFNSPEAAVNHLFQTMLFKSAVAKAGVNDGVAYTPAKSDGITFSDFEAQARNNGTNYEVITDENGNRMVRRVVQSVKVLGMGKTTYEVTIFDKEGNQIGETTEMLGKELKNAHPSFFGKKASTKAVDNSHAGTLGMNTVVGGEEGQVKISEQFKQILNNEKTFDEDANGNIVEIERFTESQRAELERMHEENPELIERLVNQKNPVEVEGKIYKFPTSYFEGIKQLFELSKNGGIDTDVLNTCIDEGYNAYSINEIAKIINPQNKELINYLVKSKKIDETGAEVNKYDIFDIEDFAAIEGLTFENIKNIESKYPDADGSDIRNTAKLLSKNEILTNALLQDKRFNLIDIPSIVHNLPKENTNFVLKLMSQKIIDEKGNEVPRYTPKDIINSVSIKPDEIERFEHYADMKNSDGSYRFDFSEAKNLTQTNHDISTAIDFSITDANGKQKYLLNADCIISLSMEISLSIGNSRYDYLKHDNLANVLRQQVKDNSISGILSEGYLNEHYSIIAQDKQGNPINIVFRVDKNNNPVYVSTETIIHRNGKDIIRKEFADHSRIVEEIDNETNNGSQVQLGYRKTYFDSEGKQVRSEVLAPSKKKGEFTLNSYDRTSDGGYKKTELGSVKTFGSKEQGSRVEKYLTAPDGTHTYQLKIAGPKGSSSKYVITDSDGVTELLSIERTHRQISDNHYESTLNGQKYDIKFEGETVTASKIDENGNITETVTLDSKQLDPQLMKLYKQLPGDYFFIIKEIGLVVNTDPSKVGNLLTYGGACYDSYTNVISINTKLQDNIFLFAHELGHAIDEKILNSMFTDKNYKNSVERDKENYSGVSTLAEGHSIDYFTKNGMFGGSNYYKEIIAESWGLMSGGTNLYTELYGNRNAVLQANMAPTIAKVGKAILDPVTYLRERQNRTVNESEQLKQAAGKSNEILGANTKDNKSNVAQTVPDEGEESLSTKTIEEFSTEDNSQSYKTTRTTDETVAIIKKTKPALPDAILEELKQKPNVLNSLPENVLKNLTSLQLQRLFQAWQPEFAKIPFEKISQNDIGTYIGSLIRDPKQATYSVNDIKQWGIGTPGVLGTVWGFDFTDLKTESGSFDIAKTVEYLNKVSTNFEDPKNSTVFGRLFQIIGTSKDIQTFAQDYPKTFEFLMKELETNKKVRINERSDLTEDTVKEMEKFLTDGNTPKDVVTLHNFANLLRMGYTGNQDILSKKVGIMRSFAIRPEFEFNNYLVESQDKLMDILIDVTDNPKGNFFYNQKLLLNYLMKNVHDENAVLDLVSNPKEWKKFDSDLKNRYQSLHANTKFKKPSFSATVIQIELMKRFNMKSYDELVRSKGYKEIKAGKINPEILKDLKYTDKIDEDYFYKLYDGIEQKNDTNLSTDKLKDYDKSKVDAIIELDPTLSDKILHFISNAKDKDVMANVINMINSRIQKLNTKRTERENQGFVEKVEDITKDNNKLIEIIEFASQKPEILKLTNGFTGTIFQRYDLAKTISESKLEPDVINDILDIYRKTAEPKFKFSDVNQGFKFMKTFNDIELLNKLKIQFKNNLTYILSNTTENNFDYLKGRVNNGTFNGQDVFFTQYTKTIPEFKNPDRRTEITDLIKEVIGFDKYMAEYTRLQTELNNAKSGTKDIVAKMNDLTNKFYAEKTPWYYAGLVDMKLHTPEKYQKIKETGFFDMVESGYLPAKSIRNLNHNSDLTPNMYADLQAVKEGRSIIPEFAKGTPLGHVFSKTEMGDAVAIGDKMYINDGENLVEWKMSKEKYLELFPPVLRFASGQQSVGNCFFVTSLFSSMEDPSARPDIYKSFELKGNDIVVTIKAYEDYDGSTTYENSNIVLPPENRHMAGCKGLQMYEQAYARVALREESLDPLPSLTMDIAPQTLMSRVNGGWAFEVMSEIHGIDNIARTESGKVEWDTPIPDKGRFSVGIHFQNKSPDAVSKLEGYLERFVKKGSMVKFGTIEKPNADAESMLLPEYNIVSNHAYSISGYDKNTKTVIISNPHNGAIVTHIPIDVLSKYISNVYITKFN